MGAARAVVLCVDDEPHNLDLLDRALRRRFEVVTEALPSAALAALELRPEIAVLVVDFRMPGMNGVELLARAAQLRPDVRRVLVTGYADADTVMAAVNNGGVHYVVRKPWRPPELVTLVAELVHARELAVENQRLVEELREANQRLLVRERQLMRSLDDQGHEFGQTAAQLERVSEQLAAASFKDALTGLYNHGIFQERLREEVARAQRNGTGLALLLIDVDGFAQVNHALGYQAGDAILRRVAELLTVGDSPGRVRGSDIAARFGGEEFALILLDTGKAGAIAKANRIRETVASADLVRAWAAEAGEPDAPGAAADRSLTVTVGVAALPDDATTPDALLSAAEAALRAAKASAVRGDGSRGRVHFLTADGGSQAASLVATPGAPADRFRPYHDRMNEVIAILQRDRAMSCLYVDLAQLERIQVELGVAPHAELYERAGHVLDRLRGPLLKPGDLICRSNDDDSYVCLLSPRDASQVDLERLATAVAEAVAAALAPSVREMLRDEPRVHVGSARVLSNPMVRHERLVARLVTEAQSAARLARERGALRDKAVLQDIILGDALIPVYQPIVSIVTGEIFGHEALTRGPRGTRMESPATLFAVADEVDLTFELDRACFRGALRRAVGLEPVHRLFVNLLPLSFYDASFIEIEVSHLLAAATLTPAHIVFEISERLAIENFAAFRRALAIYTSMGFGVAIDDVGTRHSNLETVMALRPHFIKISDVLTRGVARSTVKREMLRSLAHIADAIDAVIVAEGIETIDDLIALRELGIRYGQGYYMARPGPPFPRIKASVRRSIQALGERGPVPLPAPPATFDPDDDSDVDDLDATDLDGHDAGVAHGSGAVRLPAAPPGAAHAQPLAEALRALVQPEDEEPLEPAGPDDERSEETQPHRVPGWRERRAAASTPPASQRPLIDSLRQRDDEVAPAVENPPKGDLN
ncbi:MAG: EAL domain-containing protein [Myxococcales bacterium]|nr:EAL domain-containing protein [Myxococcales bacterium]MBK7193255.1 EAL domain-containing protein [Myxococcales bacterium]MBP6842319.1 EAL domain-containing protein [Kofleriaceae bacterium]